jgi:hypothetical protein
MTYVLPRQVPSKNAPFGAFFVSTIKSAINLDLSGLHKKGLLAMKY